MQSSSAYILVFHGSHDPRYQRAAKQLTEIFLQKIQHSTQVSQAVGQDLSGLGANPERSVFAPHHSFSDNTFSSEPSVWVRDTYLECYPLPLSEQIDQFVCQVQSSSDTSDTIRWRVIPVFLLSGMHVMEDLPAAIETLQSHQTLSLNVTPHVGSHSGLKRLLNERMSALPMEAWILMAHGSRRSEASLAIEQLATDLGVVPAYWSTPPTLEDRIQELKALGIRKIGVLPYFLFSGGITDAIAQRIDQFAQAFPQLTLTLSQPLDHNIPELADLLVDLATTDK